MVVVVSIAVTMTVTISIVVSISIMVTITVMITIDMTTVPISVAQMQTDAMSPHAHPNLCGSGTVSVNIATVANPRTSFFIRVSIVIPQAQHLRSVNRISFAVP
jgi:hypothetical protein